MRRLTFLIKSGKIILDPSQRQGISTIKLIITMDHYDNY